MPYVLLGIVAIIILAVTWRRTPSPLRPWSFLTTGGAITVGDLVITGILCMYQYRPGFLPRIRDNYLGVLIAECLFVPAYYAFLSQFSGRHRYLVYCIAVTPILLLEVLFLNLGIFIHRGWTLWHSLGTFLGYSLGAAYWAGSFQRRGYTPLHRFLLISSTVLYAMNLWGLVPFGILRLSRIHLNLVESAELDHVLSSLLLHAVPFNLAGTIGTLCRWTRRPIFLAAVWAGFGLWLTLLQYFGIRTGRFPWSPWVEGFLVSLVMAGVGWVDAWFSAHASRPRPIPPWEPPAEATRPEQSS